MTPLLTLPFGFRPVVLNPSFIFSNDRAVKVISLEFAGPVSTRSTCVGQSAVLGLTSRTVSNIERFCDVLM